MTLTVPRPIYDEMVRHCIDGLPNEACGFLGGNNGDATALYPLANAALSPVYYRPEGKEMIAAFNDMDEQGLELVAIYHSHVASPPYPSVTDVREAHHPVAYVIVSLSDLASPECRAFDVIKADWRDETGEISEVDLVVS